MSPAGDVTLVTSNVFKQSMGVCFSFKFHLDNSNEILKYMNIHRQTEQRLGRQQASYFSNSMKNKILYSSLSLSNSRGRGTQMCLRNNSFHSGVLKGSNISRRAQWVRERIKKILMRTNKMFWVASQYHTP